MGELGDDEGPAANVEANQPQRLRRGGDPLESKQPVSSDQAAFLPTRQDLAQSLLAQLPRDLRRAGRQPTEQDAKNVRTGGVLLTQPAQGSRIPLGDAGVNAACGGRPRPAAPHHASGNSCSA